MLKALDFSSKASSAVLMFVTPETETHTAADGLQGLQTWLLGAEYGARQHAVLLYQLEQIFQITILETVIISNIQFQDDVLALAELDNIL